MNKQQNEKEPNKCNVNSIVSVEDYFYQNFNYGLIIKANHNQILKLKQYLKNEDIYLVFDKISSDLRLWIVDKKTVNAGDW